MLGIGLRGLKFLLELEGGIRTRLLGLNAQRILLPNTRVEVLKKTRVSSLQIRREFERSSTYLSYGSALVPVNLPRAVLTFMRPLTISPRRQESQESLRKGKSIESRICHAYTHVQPVCIMILSRW